MIAQPQPSCHNRLKSLNSFSVGLLGDLPQIPGLLSVIFRLIEAHRNEIQAQPASFAANRSGCSARGSGTRGFASFQAHLCLRRLSHLTPAAVMPDRAAPAGRTWT